jgi:hypothetical protein
VPHAEGAGLVSSDVFCWLRKHPPNCPIVTRSMQSRPRARMGTLSSLHSAPLLHLHLEGGPARRLMPFVAIPRRMILVPLPFLWTT